MIRFDILNIFLIVHSAFVTATFWSTGVGVVGLPGRVWSGDGDPVLAFPWVCFPVAASVYLLVYEGLWQSLSRFPWKLLSSWIDWTSTKTVTEKLVGHSCGWPFDRFLGDVRTAECFQITRIDMILISMLFGWLVFCFESLVPDPRDQVVSCRCSSYALALAIPLMRLTLYVGMYRDPISFWGRVRTGRWIIPGYDRCICGAVTRMAGGAAGDTHLLSRAVFHWKSRCPWRSRPSYSSR